MTSTISIIRGVELIKTRESFDLALSACRKPFRIFCEMLHDSMLLLLQHSLHRSCGVNPSLYKKYIDYILFCYKHNEKYII